MKLSVPLSILTALILGVALEAAPAPLITLTCTDGEGCDGDASRDGSCLVSLCVEAPPCTFVSCNRIMFCPPAPSLNITPPLVQLTMVADRRRPRRVRGKVFARYYIYQSAYERRRFARRFIAVECRSPGTSSQLNGCQHRVRGEAVNASR